MRRVLWIRPAITFLHIASNYLVPVLAKNCEFTYPGLWSMCRAVNLQPACENLTVTEFTYPGIFTLLQFAILHRAVNCDCMNSHIRVSIRKVSRICTMWICNLPRTCTPNSQLAANVKNRLPVPVVGEFTYPGRLLKYRLTQPNTAASNSHLLVFIIHYPLSIIHYPSSLTTLYPNNRNYEYD